MNRAKKASLVFGTLQLLGVGFAVSPLPDAMGVPMSTLDVAVTCLSVPLGLGAAIGLWRQQRWGWNVAMLSIAVELLDSIRVTATDPEFEVASITAFGMILLLFAAILWTVDAERLRADIVPPPPDSGFLSARLYPPVAKTGLVIVAVTLIGSLWGGLVLIVWVALMFWVRARRRGDNAIPPAGPPYNRR